MVRTKMFDNIMKVHRQELTTIANVIQSIELDLELPRGFVAKIKKVIMDHDGNIAVGDNHLQMALINDPDDNQTTLIPQDEVQHDVICGQVMGATHGTVTTGDIYGGEARVEYNFDQELDVIAARNLRFNALAATPTPTFSRINVIVYYTLEEIHDSLILELLDIL